MKKDLPRLTLTPIEPTQQAQAGTEPARRNPPLPRYDGPPAYLRGAGRTVPHGAPGVLTGEQPEPQPEDPQAQWEQAVAQQAQQTPEPPSGAKRDVYDAAQAFWELMRGAKRRPKASDILMDGDQAAPGAEPIAQGAWAQEHPRRFFRRDASLGQRQGVAALAQQAWQSKKHARSGAARHTRPQRTEKQAGAPFLTTLQGQISVCVGVILLALAVKAVDSPAAQSVSATVSDAITMEVDVDQDVGKLRFVQNLFPDTVAVWFSKSAPESLTPPIDGRVDHRFSQQYPGIGISAKGQEVYACETGRVSDVACDELGNYSVTVTHKGGLETVYGTLSQALVEKGDKVRLGDSVGLAKSAGSGYELFLQVRLDGEAVDPLPYFTGGENES